MSLPAYFAKSVISKWIARKFVDLGCFFSVDAIEAYQQKINEHKDAQNKEVVKSLHGGVTDFWSLYPDCHLEFFERHKDLRQYLESHGATGQPARDLSSVVEKVRKINDVSFTVITLAGAIAVEGLKKYFETTKRAENRLPRIGVKLFYDDGRILELACNGSQQFTEDEDFSEQAYNAMQNGDEYYLNPDIPDAARRNMYSNPRLDPRRAAIYRSPNAVESEVLVNNAFPYYDDDWAKCWNDYATPKSKHSWFYKSSLVVPTRLSAEATIYPAIKELFDGYSPFPVACIYMDHLKSEYFSEKYSTDIYIAGIYAKMLAFPFLYYLCLISKSKTYRDALIFIGETDPSALESIQNDSKPIQ